VRREVHCGKVTVAAAVAILPHKWTRCCGAVEIGFRRFVRKTEAENLKQYWHARIPVWTPRVLLPPAEEQSSRPGDADPNCEPCRICCVLDLSTYSRRDTRECGDTRAASDTCPASDEKRFPR